jgi:hypothetical protein
VVEVQQVGEDLLQLGVGVDVDGDDLALIRHAPELREHESRNRVVLFILGQRQAQFIVQVVDSEPAVLVGEGAEVRSSDVDARAGERALRVHLRDLSSHRSPEGGSPAR